MAAVLQIRVDAADVRSAFGGLIAESERASQKLSGIEQKRKREYDRTLAEEKRAAIRAALEKQRAEEKAAKAKVKAEEDAQKRIQRINQNLALFQLKAAKDRTKAEEQEARKRTKIAEKEAEDAKKLAQAKARAKDRALREETRAAERQARNEFAHHQRTDRRIQQQYRQSMRENRQREQEEGSAMRRSMGRGASFAQHVIGAAGAATSEYLGAAAGARATYGDREHTLNAALVQANISGTNAVAARQRISNFLVSGQGQGINGDELAQALLATQTQTNILARQGGLETFLSNAQLAASTYQDVGEVTRVGGILGNLGVTGADQRSALMSLIGISRAGSVELKDVSTQALQGVQMAISQQVSANPNVTGAARRRMISETAAQALAVTEVGAGAGLTPRDSLNAYNKLTRGMTSDITIENLRGSLHQRYNDEDFNRIDAELFQEYRDARNVKRHRLRNADTLQFGQRLTELFGGNVAALTNAMAGSGGPGGGMVFDSQTRRLMAQMVGRDEHGKTGWGRITDLRGVKATEEEVQAGADMLASEKRTRDTLTEERRLQGLMNQPTQDTVADINAYRAENPWTSAFIRNVTPWGMGELVESGVAKMMGFAGAVPGGQSTQRGAAGAGGAAQAVPVTLDQRSIQGLANTLRGVPITASIDQHTAALAAGQDGRSPAQRNGTE